MKLLPALTEMPLRNLITQLMSRDLICLLQVEKKSRKENLAILHFIQIKVGCIQNRALKNKDKPQP